MVFPSVFLCKHMTTYNQRKIGIFSCYAAAKTQILRLKSINKPQKMRVNRKSVRCFNYRKFCDRS